MHQRDEIIHTVLSNVARLLPDEKAQWIRGLPIKEANSKMLGWGYVSLPDWADDLVPEGHEGLLVPIYSSDVSTWERHDWWQCAYDMLFSSTERLGEQERGTYLSYSSRAGFEVNFPFEHAWFNRVLLFLRRWAGQFHGVEESHLFGELPRPRLYLTHDVDAVKKTLPIRVKQAVQDILNLRFVKALRMIFGRADYNQFANIQKLENAYSVKSTWFFFGGEGGWRRSPFKVLMDPMYDVAIGGVGDVIRLLVQNGHRIGLHPSFGSFTDSHALDYERRRLTQQAGVDIRFVRQHWLHFAFTETWAAQYEAGLRHDFTFGFNDRFGFRNSAAITFKDSETGMIVTPLILMDSHLFDYRASDRLGRRKLIDTVLDELETVSGEGSIVWHQRVFHSDYGWSDEYEYLLRQIKERGFETI